jgi:hypothetical protein
VNTYGNQTLELSDRRILRHLPMWKTTSGSNVSAVNASILPDDNLLPPGLQPTGDYVSGESESARKLMRALGAKMMDPEEYVSRHVFPHVERVLRTPDPPDEEVYEGTGLWDCLISSCQPKRKSKRLSDKAAGKLPLGVNPEKEVSRTGIALLGGLLLFICMSPALLCSAFAGRPLVPNRNGELCRISDLYDPNEAIFAATFEGNHSKFPHPHVDTRPLKKMGFNWILTKKLFITCAQYIDNEFKTQGPSDALHRRACDVWTGFNRRILQFNPAWTPAEIGSLANYHIVPISRFVSAVSTYRDSVRAESNKALIAMKDVMMPLGIPVLWTLKRSSMTPPCIGLTNLFSFEPTVKDVLTHLVTLTTTISSKCRIDENGFYEDLIQTYIWLNNEEHRAAAGLLLRNEFADKAVWLNEEINLANISTRTSQVLTASARIDALGWRRAGSLVDGIPYDAPESDIFALKESLEAYKALILAAGMSVVKDHFSPMASEEGPDHMDTILGKALKEMQKANKLCDMTIIVDRERFHAHRVLLVTFSSYFRAMLGTNDWIESSGGILDLDTREKSGTTDNSTMSGKYATARGVTALLEWIYEGKVLIDDSNLDSADSVSDRLDLYLEILQLTDAWGVPTLKTHIENRILRRAREFIRVENVTAVSSLVHLYNAKEVANHCKAFMDLNKEVVEHIQSRVRS